MKIQYLTTSLEGGGAEGAIPRIVRVMRECGHSVEVTACEPRNMGVVPLLQEAGIGYRLLFGHRRGNLARIRAFAQQVRESRPDVIWTSLSAAGLVGAVTGTLLGVPVVSWKNCANRHLHTRMLRDLSQIWVADSRSVASYLTRRARVADTKVMTWPLFARPAFNGCPPPWDGRTVLHIGSAGRLHVQKNYDRLIEAVAHLFRTHPGLEGRLQVTLLGEGPERARLEALIARHGLEATIHLPGFVDDVQPFLLSWHAYVQPSRYEGMCLAAHEAMAAGLPVVVTPVGELAESVRASGGGVLLEGDIVTSLAEQLEWLLCSPRQLLALGRAGKAWIEETYSDAAFVRAGRAVIERVEALAGARVRRTLQ